MTPHLRIPFAAALTVAAVFVANRPALAAPEPPPAEDGVAVQARGPVHEAYAQPYDATPQPGPVAPKPPPDPVPELPPDQKPEGDNVQWIPGYWSWDGDRKDYVWVSGFWRAAPPDRKWVAGYWRKGDDGYQWVSGYWGAGNQERPPLLEQPPQPPDAGPSVPAPDDRSFYVPGSWVPRADRFAWRPGYWRPARLGWVWVPAHYVWTPGGSIFVDGYWDYPLETRGVLFAPVVFSQPLWQTPGWCYRPRYTVCVDDSFFASLFVGPSCGDYYFGDYYDPAYLTAGYQPWCRYGPRHYDPLYGYYRWSHRDNPGWLRGIDGTYAGRRAGDLPRPARTLIGVASAGRRAAPALVRPLSDFRGGLRLATIDRTQVARHQAAARQVVEAARQRVQVEHPAGRGRSAGPVIINQRAEHVTSQQQHEVRAAPHVEHQAAPAVHAAPQQHEVHAAPHVEHQAAPAPHVTHQAAPVAHAPQRHASPAPSHAAAHHIGPPAHYSRPAPAHSSAPHGGGGKGGKKK
jgi:hypothetical protein